jgi:hypothetical protein
MIGSFKSWLFLQENTPPQMVDWNYLQGNSSGIRRPFTTQRTSEQKARTRRFTGSFSLPSTLNISPLRWGRRLTAVAMPWGMSIPARVRA